MEIAHQIIWHTIANEVNLIFIRCDKLIDVLYLTMIWKYQPINIIKSRWLRVFS